MIGGGDIPRWFNDKVTLLGYHHKTRVERRKVGRKKVERTKVGRKKGRAQKSLRLSAFERGTTVGVTYYSHP